MATPPSASPPPPPFSSAAHAAEGALSVGVDVVWDVHSVSPAPQSLLDCCHRLQSLGLRYGHRLSSFRVLAADGHLTDAERTALDGCGVEVEEFHSDKDAASSSSLFVLTRLCHSALSLSLHPLPPSSPRPVLVLVTGDADLGPAVSMLSSTGLFGDVVLVHPSGAASSLVHSATAAVSWRECLGVARETSDSDDRRMSEGESWTGSSQVSPSHSRHSSDSFQGNGDMEKVTGGRADEAKAQSEAPALEAVATSHPDRLGAEGSERLTKRNAVAAEDEFELLSTSVANMGLMPSPAHAQAQGRDFDFDAFHSATAAFAAANQWEQLPHVNSTFSSTMPMEGSMQGKLSVGPSAEAFSSAPASYSMMAAPTDRMQPQFTDSELVYAEAQRFSSLPPHYPHQQPQMQPSHSRFYPSAMQGSKPRKLSNGMATAPLPLLVQPSIPAPVQSSAAMRASDRPSPRHRQFIAVFHRVLAYCEQEKIIPRESVVKKRLLDSKLSIDVDFEEFLAVVEDSGNAVIEGEAPQRVIWPRHQGEGGGARRFACADFFQPSQRLSTEQTHELLMFLGQFQPTIDRGRFGFAQWLARHGPKFIQTLPHGVLVELVQLLLNQKVLLFRKGKVSVSPALNSDPALFLNAINSAQGAEGGSVGAATSNPTTPPHTPPSQPQWPQSASVPFSHQQGGQQSMPYAHQQQMYPSMYSHQSQRGWLGGRPFPGGLEGVVSGSQYAEFAEDDFARPGMGMEGHPAEVNDRLVVSPEGKLRGKEPSKERQQRKSSGYKTWSHPNIFMSPFTGLPVSQPPSMGPGPIPSSQSSLPVSISTAHAQNSQTASSPPSSAPSTPLASPGGAGSPFPHPIGRPRMMSMPPQIPRPPSIPSGQPVPSPSDGATAAIPSRVPSRSSQASASFSGPSGHVGPDSALSPSPALVSPTSQDRPMTGDLSFQTTPTRPSGTSQLYNSGSSGGSGSTAGGSSRKTTPHTSPVLSSQTAPSFSTRPSSPFEFGLPISAADSGLFSASSSPSSASTDKPQDEKPARPPSSGLPPVPASSGRVDSRLKVVRSLNISSPVSGTASPMSHTASLSILSSLASTTSPSVPVTPNSTSFFSSHSPMSQAGDRSQPNSADSSSSTSGGRSYGDEQEGRPRSVSNPVEPYQLLVGAGHVTQQGQGLAPSKRAVGSHQRHHSSSANAPPYEVALAQHQREQQLQPQQPSAAHYAAFHSQQPQQQPQQQPSYEHRQQQAQQH